MGKCRPRNKLLITYCSQFESPGMSKKIIFINSNTSKDGGVYRYYLWFKRGLKNYEVIDSNDQYAKFNFSIHYLYSLVEGIGKERDAIIVTNALKAGFITFLLKIILRKKIDYIYINHGLRYTQVSGALRYLYFLLEWCIVGLSKKSIYVNEYEFKRTKIKNKRNIYIPHPFFEKKNLSEKIYDIAFVGRLDDNKGIEKFYRVIAEKPDYRYLVIGDGPLKDSLSALKEGAYKVDYYPNLDNKMTIKKLSMSKLILSLSKIETFPITQIEAAGCKCTFLSTEYVNKTNPHKDKFSKFIYKNLEDLLIDLEFRIKNFDSDSEYQKEVIIKRHPNYEQWLNKYEEIL